LLLPNWKWNRRQAQEPAGSLEKLMVMASELREGMALRIDEQVYRVLEVEAKAGAAKMGGNVRARLANVRSGRIWDQHFRPLERLEDVELQKCKVEFLYSDGRNCIFQRLDSFEQVEFPCAGLGLAGKLLEAGTEALAEFFEGEPINVVLPDTVEARVVTTAPPARSQQDSARKEAALDNGLAVQVPLFVAPGELVSIDLRTGRYVERVRTQHKKGV
jgi:elongation factor P